MSWTKFFYIIIGIYTFYYLINIVIDSLKSKEINDSSGHTDELTFQEDIEPADIKPQIITTPTAKEELPELDKTEELEHANLSWARQDEDTEEITLLSHNTNTSTGGTTQMSELIRLAQSNTIDYKNSLVFY